MEKGEKEEEEEEEEGERDYGGDDNDDGKEEEDILSVILLKAHSYTILRQELRNKSGKKAVTQLIWVLTRGRGYSSQRL